MKCKTCKYWDYKTKICSGLSAEYKVVPLPPVVDFKGKVQKRGKLLTIRSGVIGVRNPMTQEDFYCKNWRQK
jgi:hypothetical protein